MHINRSISLLSSRIATLFGGAVCLSVFWYAIRRSRVKQFDEKNEFCSKTVVITGAAGDIGSTTANAFARRGATLVLVDLPRTRQKLLADQKDLLVSGANSVHVLTADITKTDDVQNIVSEAIKMCGHIDCFFNNAGVQGELLPLDKQSDDGFEHTLRVNVLGVFLGMKYVAKAMINSKRGGVIVNTASVAGVIGAPNMTAYTASKFAVVGMTRTGAKDLAPYGIRVCAIAPGLLEGKLWMSQVKGQANVRKERNDKEGDLTEQEITDQEERMIQGTPLHRLGTLSEVAEVVVFLCSDRASYITGEIVKIDGGRSS